MPRKVPGFEADSELWYRHDVRNDAPPSLGDPRLSRVSAPQGLQCRQAAAIYLSSLSEEDEEEDEEGFSSDVLEVPRFLR